MEKDEYEDFNEEYDEYDEFGESDEDEEITDEAFEEMLNWLTEDEFIEFLNAARERMGITDTPNAIKNEDAILNFVNTEIAKSEAGVQVTNIDRLVQCAVTYQILLDITEGEDVKITYATNSPFTSMGYISVTGKNITFKNTGLFVKAATMASNFEIYPKRNKKVQMDFAFHNLTRKVTG